MSEQLHLPADVIDTQAAEAAERKAKKMAATKEYFETTARTSKAVRIALALVKAGIVEPDKLQVEQAAIDAGIRPPSGTTVLMVQTICEELAKAGLHVVRRVA